MPRVDELNEHKSQLWVPVRHAAPLFKKYFVRNPHRIFLGGLHLQYKSARTGGAEGVIVPEGMVQTIFSREKMHFQPAQSCLRRRLSGPRPLAPARTSAICPFLDQVPQADSLAGGKQSHCR